MKKAACLRAGHRQARRVCLREKFCVKKAHCIEGALFAGLALWYHGKNPLVVHFATDKDEDHVIVVFKEDGFWGAISKIKPFIDALSRPGV